MKTAPADGPHRCALVMVVGDAVSVTGVTVSWGVAVTVNEVGVGGDALPTPLVAQPAASKAIPISSAAFITRRRGIAASPSHRNSARASHVENRMPVAWPV